MKIKIITKSLLVLICIMVMLQAKAQRCAVLEFKAGVGISQADVDGISAIFITYFQPSGYTMVERTQIDKVIEEQGFQRSTMTQAQMVRVGQILNVSKIVVGDINVVMNQYNVDTRVINVETGTIAATEGATFATSSYRSSMQNIATKLASKIAIASGATVQARSTSSYTPKKRTTVEVLYGYLKIFPNELGSFQSEPTSVIAQINKQAQHGYNNWRIPTNEELSLLRANNYLGDGPYMTRESRNGIVLLVSDGDDYQTVQEQERKAQEKRRAEQERLAAEERAKQERLAYLKAQGLVDLGLPSGTLWKNENEEKRYNYDDAVSTYGNKLPTKTQWLELINNCKWSYYENGCKVTGPNGNHIFLPCVPGTHFYYGCDSNMLGQMSEMGQCNYWSSTSDGTNNAWKISWHIISKQCKMNSMSRCSVYSVRLIHN